MAMAEKEPARRDNCPDCLGDGFSKEPGADPLDTCKKCDGKGWIPAEPISEPRPGFKLTHYPTFGSPRRVAYRARHRSQAPN